MQTITVGLGRKYPILVGAGLLDKMAEYLAPLKATSIFIVTDATVAALYLAQAQTALGADVRVNALILEPGEVNKELPSISMILDALAAAQADRKSVLLALGGGVVGDMAGFAAAIYMRGIRFVQIPTTLLAQVDSSVGGKTGVNHPRGKNLIGAFHQPELVVSDITSLRTLPPRELHAGLAEVIKHGLLADAVYFDQVARNMPMLLAGDTAALSQAIVRSCEIKAEIVARDEREAGERALLNLGHTFGHAIESLTGYSQWVHGEAVACGMCLAADLSQRLGMLTKSDVARVVQVVESAGLPSRISGLSMAAAIESMRGDKKSEGGHIKFVLLERIGKALQMPAPPEALQATLQAAGYTA